jgi:hypothetical protein
MLESNNNNNDNNKNKMMIMISMTIKCIKMYENIRNDDTITNKNNSKNNNKLKKVLIFFFPGAWILGNIESVHGICRYFATFTDFLVVSVQYRLAPEYAYPHAFYDAYAALQWVKHKHIFISGDDDDDDDDVDDDNDASGVVWDANDDCDDTIGIVVMTNVNEMLHLYDDDWNDSSGDMMGNTIHNNLIAIDMIDYRFD